MEMVNKICNSRRLSVTIKDILKQDPVMWDKQTVHDLIYYNYKVRPQSLIVSYMLCEELLSAEKADSILREENLLSRLLVTWMEPVQFNIKKDRPKKMSLKLLQASFKHLKISNISFHQNLQRQLCEKKLQTGLIPVVYINIFLRFYIPQFRVQSKHELKLQVLVSRIVQCYVNHTLAPIDILDEMTFLRNNPKLQNLSKAAIELFYF